MFAEVAGLRRRLIVTVPVLSPSLSSRWVGLVTPLPSDLARPLVDSLVNEVVVHDPDILEHRPRDRLSYRDSVALALRRVHDLRGDHDLGRRRATGPEPRRSAAGGPGMVGRHGDADVQASESTATTDELFATVQGIGGERGWFAGEWLWRLRGLIDRFVGGVGHPAGSTPPRPAADRRPLDFWRVEALGPGHILRLRAEMRLPGEAWLEWDVEPTDEGSRLTQRALFHPRGLWGRAYWFSVAPFHHFVFRPMALRLVERTQSGAGSTAVIASAGTS